MRKLKNKSTNLAYVFLTSAILGVFGCEKEAINPEANFQNTPNFQNTSEAPVISESEWSSRASITCNHVLTHLTTIQNYEVYKHSTGAIVYKARMVIDADGSPRAYGPNNSGLDYTANAGYPGNWWGIVTNSSGSPIIQSSTDPYPGMYVSTTSMVNSAYSKTNPKRYIDSENIPYIAIPSALKKLGNIQIGDVVYVYNQVTNKACYAIYADTGPSGKLGEGSIYLAKKLGLNPSPRNGGTSSQVITYIIFPKSGSGNGVPKTPTQINIMGNANIKSVSNPNVYFCL